MTRNKLYSSILLLLLVPFAMRAQVDITRNAYSVVQNATTEIICESATSALQKESYTITILNEKGRDAAHFFCMCDKFRSLRKFSGEITDPTGKVIRKIKKSDLQMTEYSSGLTSDDYTYYYECNLPRYPLTIKYEWEVKCKDGLIAYPNFVPQKMYNQSVVKAAYSLRTPPNMPTRYRAINIRTDITQKTTPDGNILTEASIGPIAALEYEPFGASLSERIPRIYFSPEQFIFDGTQGDMSTWQSYGAWQNSLLTGRDQLAEPIKTKLRELTAHCTTPREKVQAIYNYLATTTRYVSIQLGIGGLQPIAAADVCRAGFGDCKGLSNYTRAMLNELGISSVYTAISTDNERLLPDFSSANQMNHVILQVPLPGDTLWLECTNPQLPFGYIHSDIAGHDALLVTPDGGKLHRLPSYPDSLNTQTTIAQITLTPTGGAKVKACETSRLFQYESMIGITHLEPARQKDHLRSNINLVQANISDVQITEKKDAIPQIDLQYAVDTEQYGNKTGNRLFIPANIFRKGFTTPELKQRIQDVHINYGYLDTDSILLQIPEGYAIESLPKSYKAENNFGTFSSSLQVKGKEIYIVHRLLMHKGVYPKESYKDFLEFRKQIAGQYNSKIILKKEVLPARGGAPSDG